MNESASASYHLSTFRRQAPAGWDASLARLGGNYYLSPAFSRALAKEGSEPVFFRLSRDGVDIGLGLGFLTNHWKRWPARVLTRGFQWQTHPVVAGDDPELLERFVRMIVADMEALGVNHVKLHSEDARLSPSGLAADGFALTERLEFRVKLSADPAEVISRIASRKRTYLRSAIKASTLQIREENKVESVGRMIDFQAVSRERRRQRGEDYAIATSSAANAIYQNYVAPGNGRIFISYQADQPDQALSGILLHCDQGRAYYTMSGCSEAGFALNAQMMTVWGAIEKMCAEGYTEMNMGGVHATAADASDLGHGLYRFKRSFGGDEIRCLTWEKSYSGLRSRIAGMLKL